jgi:hypothetical protein
MWENIYANNNIDVHNYVINIHKFSLKLVCDKHGQWEVVYIKIYFETFFCSMFLCLCAYLTQTIYFFNRS